ncbi:ArnT family glycosyltransferase [Aeromicrobium sp. 179-A 4D2 NHS]|uniref:ArnT family glycosyltransferase n=1 Tax=Aeromicrobium sp. 179-A 4D2 NHS TaxID=3142375 RepID=UPI00399F652E
MQPQASTASRLALAVAVVAVLLRLPFLAVQPSPDEAGLLIVAGQWHAGDSLYGDYWVDRPPVLMAVFEVADAAGGVVALRVIGLVAVVATILLCAATARRFAGPRASLWAAIAAGVLTVSPWLGADRVNAELLAAPWIAAGVYAAVRAVEGERWSPWALLCGAAVTGAVATKQNMVDAGVFLVVLLIAMVVSGRMPVRAALRHVALAAAGAVVLAVLLLGWAWTRGTPPPDLLDALFAFRVRAAEVMSAWPSPSAEERRDELVGRAGLSGLVVLAAVVLLAPALRRFRSPACVALAAMAAYACVSISLGGSWWNHYLVQLAVPVAVGAGVVAARTRLVVPAILGYAIVSAVVGAGVVRPALGTPDAPVAAGRMIADVARPGDTVVHAWGRPDLVRASGLSSPYEQLWSLPVRTDDPELVLFRQVVEGADAPTWLVTRGTLRAPGLRTEAAERVVDRRYRPVAEVCGLRILLRRDVSRATPDSSPDVECKPSTHLR